MKLGWVRSAGKVFPKRRRLLLILLVLFCAASSAAATRAEREKEKLDSLRERRATLERALRKAETSRAAAADQLRDIEQAISAVGRKLHALGEERAEAQRELAGRQSELRQLERQTAVRQEQLARLLRHQFRPQQVDALAILLAGGDPNAAARDRHYLTLLSKAKAELIADLRRDIASQRRLADEVRERSERLAELEQREARERTMLRQRQQERQAVLARLGQQIKAQRHEIDTLRQNERRLANLIASLARRAAQLPSARGKAPPPPASAALDPAKAGGTFAQLRGKLIRPVAGKVTGRYGARRDDGQSVSKGMFFSAAEGSQVRAVAAGTVVFADWLRGYGNLLIIDHGDDFLSVYGNNQTLLADVGQKVGSGAAVATVGSSGGQTESGLYFELRHRGRAFDPGKWLGAP